MWRKYTDSSKPLKIWTSPPPSSGSAQKFTGFFIGSLLILEPVEIHPVNFEQSCRGGWKKTNSGELPTLRSSYSHVEVRHRFYTLTCYAFFSSELVQLISMLQLFLLLIQCWHGVPIINWNIRKGCYHVYRQQGLWRHTDFGKQHGCNRWRLKIKYKLFTLCFHSACLSHIIICFGVFNVTCFHQFSIKLRHFHSIQSEFEWNEGVPTDYCNCMALVLLFCWTVTTWPPFKCCMNEFQWRLIVQIVRAKKL